MDTPGGPEYDSSSSSLGDDVQMTDEGQEQHGLSALDRAYGMRLDGDVDGAMRQAASILVANPDDHSAALLVARLLLDGERAMIAGEVAERLADAMLRRGDLPSATVAANLGAEAGGFAEGALQRIAQAFAKGSERLSERSPKPPALPADVEVAPHFAKLSGGELLDAAEKAAQHFLKQADAEPADGPLPTLPLFSELGASVLGKFLGALEVREINSGQPVVTEGEDGREAFVLVRGVLNVVRGVGDGATLLAALGPGAIFGEMALVAEAPRAAAVVAVEPALLLVISRTQLESLAQQDEAVGRELGAFCQGRMVANLVRHSEILSALGKTERDEIITHFTTRSLATGEALVHQGTDSHSLFLVASGKVDVRSTDAEGDRVVLAELGPGQVVGEISLVLRKPATADVTAVMPAVVLELTQERFMDVIREHPTLLRDLYELALKRDEETRSVVAQKALDVSDVVLL